MPDPLDDFEDRPFTFDGRTRRVFWKGNGPAVIVMSEIPGITPRVADFARRVVDLGCTVVLPSLFGEPGRDPGPLYALRSLVPACVSREFRAFAVAPTSTPISRWLRALSTAAHATCGGPGVGAVGMCFTGGFALGMMLDAHLVAPVLSQPSLPIGPVRRARFSLGLGEEELAVVRARAAGGTRVLGLRFTCDRLVPAERFARLRTELGDAFIGVEIDSCPGNPWGIPRSAHSVLTEHLVDEPGHPTRAALEQVLEFLRERLVGATAGSDAS
ncbi:dienelactone hydrolase family protein [Rhabdothermincola sp.]|uniref:dienelactone hydrolase family protein n=1 Tax=Rhabdothermincola sp. TaxID=2820405 RepID=UPI002FDFC8EC